MRGGMNTKRRVRRKRRVKRAAAKQMTKRPVVVRRPVPEAWRELVGLPRPPHEADVEIVERFIEATRPKRRAETAAVLLLALDVVRDRASFLEGHWISTATTHVYTWYDGPGFRALATIALIERFIDWLFAEGQLEVRDHSRLFAMADEARAAVGAPRRRPGAIVEPSHRHDFDRLVESFVREGNLSDFARGLAGSAIRLLRTVVTRDEGPILFGRLRPAVDVPWVQGVGPRTLEDREADRQLVAIWASFYAWLGATGRLAPEQALAIERELAAWTLAPVSALPGVA